MERIRLLAVVLTLGLAACSSGGSGGGGVGAAGGAASNLDCRARSDRLDPRDGCYCEELAPGAEPSTSFPKVTGCNNTYAGAGRTLCCKSGPDCICLYIGCHSDSLVGTCNCGAGHGSAILSSQSEVSTCTPNPGGRCCANESDGYCVCDILDSTCPSQYGAKNVASCQAFSVAPTCDPGEEQVESCDGTPGSGAGGFGGGSGGSGGSGLGGSGGSGGLGGASGGSGGVGGSGGAGGSGGTGAGGGSGSGGTSGTGGSGGGAVCNVASSPPSSGSCWAGQGSCNPVLNNCPAGQACDVGTSGTFTCFPPPNDAPICGACNNTSGPFCQGGLTCVSGQCVRWCCIDGDCDGSAGSCQQLSNGLRVCIKA